MQVLAETEYQDLYRVTDGVLFVVNKFKRIDYSEKTDRYFCIYNAKTKKYNKGCQDWLKVLKEKYYDKYTDITVPKNTVLYYNQPVEPVTDKSEFKYQIKTTGESFSGNSEEMISMLNEILNKIKNKEDGEMNE